MQSAVIFNVQKYSVHDGPGIRTTVFFKGCPLKCAWCHNPESHSPKYELMFNVDRCVGCGKCASRCPEGAITIVDGKSFIDKEKCKICHKCSDCCPNSAIEYVGEECTSNEIFSRVLKDQIFYDESGGGVTFSGGEPMMHVDCVAEVAQRCKDRGIHVAIETSGFAPWSSFEKIVDKVDLFLFDIKLVDNELHKQYVGADNHIILENIKKLSDLNKRIWIRMPMITGINDGEENLDLTMDFLKTIQFEHINLLPYHSIGKGKYTKLGREYKLQYIEQPSPERMEELAQKFRNKGFKVKIGG